LLSLGGGAPVRPPLNTPLDESEDDDDDDDNDGDDRLMMMMIED